MICYYATIESPPPRPIPIWSIYVFMSVAIIKIYVFMSVAIIKIYDNTVAIEIIIKHL